MRYQIVGFCDVADKRRGKEDNTYFRDEDVLEAAVIPSRAELLSYAVAKGYSPSGKPGCNPNMCDPIYVQLEPDSRTDNPVYTGTITDKWKTS